MYTRNLRLSFHPEYWKDFPQEKWTCNVELSSGVFCQKWSHSPPKSRQQMQIVRQCMLNIQLGNNPELSVQEYNEMFSAIVYRCSLPISLNNAYPNTSGTLISQNTE